MVNETLLAKILARRALFETPELTTEEIDALADGEEADLLALAASRNALEKARALVSLPFLAMNAVASAGEWALLRSLVLDLAA